VPLEIPNLQEPMVIPANILSSVLRETGDTQIGISENMVHIMPDEYTQLKSVMYDVKYPKVSKITDREFDTSIKINRDEVVEKMNRINAFGMGERGVAFRVFFGEEEFAIYMANQQVGGIGDVVEIPGQATHDRFEIKFTPKNILDGLSHAPNNDLTLSYDAGNSISVLKIDGGSGYQSWIVPRREGDKSE
jgi:DNA polymerase III sliding clamp (beta) subunit (PCNA family)